MISEYTSKRFCCEDISKIENYDKAVSDEHKRKISDKFKGRTFSDETRRRISERCKEAWKRRRQG